MNLGFYYHVSIVIGKKGELMLPAYLGFFIEELAKNAEKLYLFAHVERTKANISNNYIIGAENIVLIDLGEKRNFIDRFLRGKTLLRKYEKEASYCDIILVRAPSPLAPYFYACFRSISKISYLVVGDYKVGQRYLETNYLKKIVTKIFVTFNEKQQNSAIRRCLTFVNSRKLYDKYDQNCCDLVEVKTTTLRRSDFHAREDTCQNGIIQLLYTGRLDMSKGIRELLHACEKLANDRIDFKLNIVGWEENARLPVESYIKSKSSELGIGDKVILHGKKEAGSELNEMYRMADIYILPSYHEGFPRTIWEAMANSLPVVATNVGSIPSFLNDNEHAILIESRQTIELYEAVLKMLNNHKLRRRMIKNSFIYVQDVTLEKQTLKIIDKLNLLLS